MLAQLKSLFFERDGAPADGGTGHSTDELTMAAAALMVEAALTDENLDGSERTRIAQLLAWRFSLPDEEATAIVAEAEAAMAERVDFHRFTDTVLKAFDLGERIRLLELLWEVVYADGVVDEREEHLMRRITGLIEVPDRESGAAKKRVAARQTGAPD